MNRKFILIGLLLVACFAFTVLQVATALGTTYEALNVWIFVILIPVAMGISILMNLYFIWKSCRHECALRETTTN